MITRPAVIMQVSMLYEQFVSGIQGEYMITLMSSGERESPEKLNKLKERIALSVSMFVNSVAAIYSNYVIGIGMGADSNAQVELSRATDVVRKIAVSNAYDLVKRARNGMLRDGNRINAADAFAQLRDKKASEFRVPDAMGRYWDAGLFLKTAVRQFVIAEYLMAQLKAFEESGVDLVQVITADSAHRNNGKVFSLSGVGYPKFEESIRAIFHPNSNAEVRPYAVS